MFGQLMEVIDNDYLRYILHVEAVQPAGGRARPGQGGVRGGRRPGGRDRRRWPALLAAEQGVGGAAADRRLAGRGDGRQAAQAGAGRRSGQRERAGSRAPGRQGADQAAERPRPRRRSRRWSRTSTRRSAATSPAGAGAARSTSSAMAPPDGAAGPAPRNPATSPPSSRRWGTGCAEAERYLGLDKLEARRAELEAEAARPDLWDDPDNARGRDHGAGPGHRRPRPARRPARPRSTTPGRCSSCRRSRRPPVPATPRSTPSCVETVDALGARLGALELQSLFSGEYDELDAVCEVHAGAGGTDAQDWTEMMLRMYQRWAERRGFTVEVDEATEGQEAGLLSATFIVHGRFAYGLLATERGVHRLVRMSPFDSQHRRQTSFASVDVDAVPRGRVGRGRDRREGSAHRHLPLVGRRRPARQQDGLGRAADPPADRDRGGRARTSAASTRTRPRRCRSSGPSWPSGPGPSARPSSTRPERGAGRQRLGQPDPLLRDGAVPVGQGPPDQLRDGQRRRRARRRPRRVHGGRAAAPAGVRRVGVRPP